MSDVCGFYVFVSVSNTGILNWNNVNFAYNCLYYCNLTFSDPLDMPDLYPYQFKLKYHKIKRLSQFKTRALTRNVWAKIMLFFT